MIDDWAEMVGRKMFAQVEREEWNQWRSVSEEISAGLRDVIGNTPVGMVAQDIVYRQIRYMKSLPLEAAGRVREIQERAIQAVIHGERPDQLYEMIMQSGDVAASRARMIARTEIGRATTALTQARALSVGSEGYWWRIKGAGTRPSHRGMKDKFVRWDSGFRTFENALHGWAAMKNQLMRYFTGKTTGRRLQTIMDIVSTWAPAADNNDPAKYARDVAGWMGVSPTAALNLSDPNTMAMLMQSMARKEGYSNWNSPLARQAAGATVNQNTVINISGVNDPREAGKIVADHQSNVSARTTQQLTRGPS